MSGDITMSNSNAAITHTGASLTVSSNTKVKIESVTFIAGAVSTVTSLQISGDKACRQFNSINVLCSHSHRVIVAYDT